jgi:hypothetical protein
MTSVLFFSLSLALSLSLSPRQLSDSGPASSIEILHLCGHSMRWSFCPSGGRGFPAHSQSHPPIPPRSHLPLSSISSCDAWPKTGAESLSLCGLVVLWRVAKLRYSAEKRSTVHHTALTNQQPIFNGTTNTLGQIKRGWWSSLGVTLPLE